METGGAASLVAGVALARAVCPGVPTASVTAALAASNAATRESAFMCLSLQGQETCGSVRLGF